MKSFNDIVKLFTEHGFNVKDFVDDFMCVLSREKDGINEAIKMNKNQVQIQAMRQTLEELSGPLSSYCKDVDI